jgi:hypothetical protein
MRFPHRVLIAIVLVAISVICGCERGPKTVPVYGLITFVGRGAPKTCRVVFRPNQTSGPVRPSVAICDSDGSYEAKSFERSNGLLPGTYGVQVLYYDLKPGSDPNVETNWAESKFDAGEVVVDAESGGVEHNIEVPAKGAPAKKT